MSRTVMTTLGSQKWNVGYINRITEYTQPTLMQTMATLRLVPPKSTARALCVSRM